MPQLIRTLPDAELAVMQAVWACEVPAKRTGISEILAKTQPKAPTTLLTVLSRPQRRILAADHKGRLPCPAGTKVL